jgi:DNA-binding beta-propeller fold protein YncE
MFRLIDSMSAMTSRRIRLALSLLLRLNLCANAFAAAPKGSLDQNVVVANDGAIWAGSVATFASGSKGNRAPQFLNVLKDNTNQQFTGLAISPATGERFVAESLLAKIVEFSPTANATKLPQSKPDAFIVGPRTGMVYPFGVAFDMKAHPTVDTTGQVYVANDCSLPDPANLGECASLNCTANENEVDGSVTIYDNGATGNAAPNLTIEGCATLLGAPVGIFVDEATVNVCTGIAADADALCEPSSGNSIVPVRTRRIWVVNSETIQSPEGFGFGLITIYAPELATFLGADDCSSSPMTGEPVCDEAPFGGFFLTATDPGNDSDPQFIAVNSSETTAYITDADIGRVKAFDLTSGAQCLATDSMGNCTTAINAFILAGFRSATSGRHTRFSTPLGISTVTTPTGDEVFVTNFDGDNLLEFGPGAILNGGDVAPLVLIKGGRTKLNEPIGLAISPPPLIP